MNVVSLFLALHILGATVWVGGMAFALLILRPSLGVLPPPQRLALHGQVFQRFFRYVWHAMPIMLLTGYAMLGTLGGFGGANWAVHLMHLTGLTMSAVFVYVFFIPWRAMRGALARQDNGAAAAALGRIRPLIAVNLALGALTVAVACWGG